MKSNRKIESTGGSSRGRNRDGGSICLLNDSFPPQIDGVATTVVNYAREIGKLGGNAVIATPDYPETSDSDFPFSVYRYRSVDVRKYVGYMAGVPFSPSLVAALQEEKVQLLHSHCPAMSTLFARELRDTLDVPLVFTYHTKFDVDIAKITGNKFLQRETVRFFVQNISACDEVWTVSRGAGENLRSLGYEGDYVIMENGVDLEKGRLSSDDISGKLKDYPLDKDVPVFLFVGRHMWYKGIRIILDALVMLKARGFSFKMVFIGTGTDEEEMKAYARDLGLGDMVIFTGPVHDRETLRAWYCRANLFLFPSTYDTNGLVVREAAACSLPSVLIAESCAAEEVEDGVNGYLIEENADAMAARIEALYKDWNAVRAVGEKASEDLYLSWAGAVSRAYERYQIVMDQYRSGNTSRKTHRSDIFCTRVGYLMDKIAQAENNFRNRYSP